MLRAVNESASLCSLFPGGYCYKRLYLWNPWACEVLINAYQGWRTWDTCHWWFSCCSYGVNLLVVRIQFENNKETKGLSTSLALPVLNSVCLMTVTRYVWCIIWFVCHSYIVWSVWWVLMAWCLIVYDTHTHEDASWARVMGCVLSFIPQLHSTIVVVCSTGLYWTAIYRKYILYTRNQQWDESRFLTARAHRDVVMILSPFINIV